MSKKENKEEKKGFDLMYIVAEPRWKWFQPPLWWCFRWAYKITSMTKFTNCVPVAMGGGPVIHQVQKGGHGSVQTQIGIVNDITFTSKGYPEKEDKEDVAK